MKPAELCSCGPVAAYSPHDAAAASGVLVPGTVTVYPAYRTNRVSILDAIDQPSASRNLSQNQLTRQVTGVDAQGFDGGAVPAGGQVGDLAGLRMAGN